MNDNPRHLSESIEHYTPGYIVEAGRHVLGGYDLDPFSSDEANGVVRASIYFGVDDNGWLRRWYGRIFINPPGGLVDTFGRRVEKDCRETGSCGLAPGHIHTAASSAQKRAWFKLVEEYAAGRVRSAIFVCFSLELLQTTQVESTGSIPLDFPICYPARRIGYIKPGGSVGKQPPHSSCIVFIPPRTGYSSSVGAFRRVFSPLGRVVVPSTDDT